MYLSLGHQLFCYAVSLFGGNNGVPRFHHSTRPETHTSAFVERTKLVNVQLYTNSLNTNKIPSQTLS